jgi:hypothetical protein
MANACLADCLLISNHLADCLLVSDHLKHCILANYHSVILHVVFMPMINLPSVLANRYFANGHLADCLMDN